ncbi:ArsC/Spx/MgsR family protein [uncultured Roseobacter sp.]|uniref:arsenate reductase family protein n=1 Tax=uncultured Roseobacter sp. TaxID=114847 RepID=UPI002629F7B8|nr:ArsC/Spx/MgsR family protein [uncultured Roseobacter sp.]
MQIYGLKNCDTCRKAMKALPQAVLVDVRADGISAELTKRALVKFGDALINTRSTTWRGLDETERARDPVDLLKSHPALMKRPLIVDGENIYLGWAPSVQAELGVM